MSPQHRFWSSGHYWLSCLQNYGEDDYEEIISVAESCRAVTEIAAIKAHATNQFAVATFYGSHDSQPGMFVFMYTSRELLLSKWNSMPAGMLKLKRIWRPTSQHVKLN